MRGSPARVKGLVSAVGVAACVALAVGGCGSGGGAAPVTASPGANAAMSPGGSLAALQARRSLKCVARVTDRHPAVGSPVGVRVRTVRGAWVKVAAHYWAGSRRQSARAGVHGRRMFWYGTARVVPGYRVRVVVRVSRHHRRGVCSAWFTPHLGSGGPQPTATPTPTGSASPTPSPTNTATPSPSPSPTQSGGGAWCSATVSSYQDSDHDEWYNDVYVHSDRPGIEATASGGGFSHSYGTDSSGYADVYLDGPPPGTQITVTVGGATCTASD